MEKSQMIYTLILHIKIVWKNNHILLNASQNSKLNNDKIKFINKDKAR